MNPTWWPGRERLEIRLSELKKVDRIKTGKAMKAVNLAMWGRQLSLRASQPDCSLDVYRNLLIRTTSLVRIPLATNNCFPSRDHEKPKMCPEEKSVI
jgi:hypothetical protein